MRTRSSKPCVVESNVRCGRTKQSRYAMRGIAIAAMQVLAIQPLLWQTPAAAQTCPADSGEAVDSYATPGSAQPADDDDFWSLEGTGSTGADDGGDDGGDRGDGGGASISPSGTDFNGDDVGQELGNGFPPANDWGMPADSIPNSVVGGTLGLPSPGSFRDNPLLPPLNYVHDPIDLSLADKRHVQVDYAARGAGALRVARVYHSNAAVNTARVTIPMGTGWHNFYDRSLQQLSGTQVRLHRANGRTLDFNWNGSTWVSQFPAGVLSQIAGGWQYVNHRDVVETYDASGRLLSLGNGGLVTSLQYDASGRLATIANPFGRSLTYAYDSAGRLATVNLPDGSTLGYSYDAQNNLVSTRFADNSVRQYTYENASFPNALTGVVDESGRRRLTWGYDAQGRPNQGYYGNGSNGVTIAYNGSQVTTTDARGTQRVRTFATVSGRSVLTSLQTAATADSAATGWSFSYDANGNLVSTTARTGELRQYAADNRARYASVTRAAGTVQAMGTQVTWHPVFRKPTQIVSRGVTWNYAIDGVGRITQVTRTAGGASTTVFSATYNAQNLLQSVTNARGATTTFTYDASGNRTSVTDALQQTTYFQNFNAHGQPTRIQRSDGVVITRVLDGRARVASRTVAGLTTSYGYDGAGRVTSVTAPDGSWRTISYDAAGKVSGSANHRGETIGLARDAAAKIVNESVFTATGNLAQTAAQQFSAVGNVKSATDSRGYSTTFLYATDGRPSGATTPLNLTTTAQLDLLDRTTAVTQPNTAAMRQITGNATATSTYGYDGNGNHTTVNDVRTVNTTYSYNPTNMPVGEAATDAGGTTVARNAAGDVVAVTRPTGITLNRTVDALGRTTAITPPTGTAIVYSYVAGRGDGLPAQMTDPSGSTTWTYDSAGRLLTKKQIALSIARTVTIARDALGRPSSITYPSGMHLDATYNVDSVASLAINGSTLLNSITYRPFSQVATGWRWGNGSSYSRSFDADGRVTSVSLGSVQRSYSYDPAGQVTGYTDQGPQGTKQTSYTYDEAGQLTGYNGPQGTGGYSYDANGNRLSSVVNGVGRSYSYFSGTNRLATVGTAFTYQYNADGNPTTDGGAFAFTYDSFGRIATETQQDNVKLIVTYNGLGQRVSKTVQRWTCTGGTLNSATSPAAAPLAPTNKVQTSATVSPSTLTTCSWQTRGLNQYVYDDAGHLLGEYDNVSGAWQETVWFNGQPVATYRSSGIYYVNADHLGTPRSIVRATDNVEVWRWDSDPFGTTPATNPAAGVSFSYNLRFPGQYLDTESSLHYNVMRDYRPDTGRYLQADPLGLGGGLSRYAYAGASPINSVDPLGLANFLFGGGGAWTKLLGGEGWAGLYLTLGGKTGFDFGVWGTGGIAYGYNIAFGVQVGYVKGDVSDLRGITYNINGGITPVGGTLMFDENFQPVGFMVGAVEEFGLSLTYAETGATGTHDLGSWLGGWIFDKTHPSQCSGK